MFKKIKQKWMKYLNSLAQTNKSSFGAGGISCCELKDTNDRKKWNVDMLKQVLPLVIVVLICKDYGPNIAD